MAIGVNGDVHEIRIVERRRRPIVGVVSEMPGRRPRLPEIAAQLAAILLQADASAFGVEVPLVPESRLGFRRSRLLPDVHGVLDGVAADQHGSADPVRVQRGRDRRGTAAPVVAGDSEARETERVSEIDHVLSDRRLFRHTWRPGDFESRGAEAAQIRNQHAMAGTGERRRHIVVGVHVVRPPVQEDDRESIRVAGFLVGNPQNVGVDVACAIADGLRKCRWRS